MSALPVEIGGADVDEQLVVARPIRPDDAERLARMFERLSPLTVYRRFQSPVVRPRPWVLRHLATVDHVDREALVALVHDEIVAVARYDRSRSDPTEAEVAVVVEDAWQRRGLGSFLLRRLSSAARRNGIERFVASMLAENEPVLRLTRKLNPVASFAGTGTERVAVMPLAPRAPRAGGPPRAA